MSMRGQEWLEFSIQVARHIDEYTVPQYGDKGDDMLDEYTAEHCVQAIKKYCARFGKNARDGQDISDLIKISHYAQIAAKKLKEETINET